MYCGAGGVERGRVGGVVVRCGALRGGVCGAVGVGGVVRRWRQPRANFASKATDICSLLPIGTDYSLLLSTHHILPSMRGRESLQKGHERIARGSAQLRRKWFEVR